MATKEIAPYLGVNPTSTSKEVLMVGSIFHLQHLHPHFPQASSRLSMHNLHTCDDIFLKHRLRIQVEHFPLAAHSQGVHARAGGSRRGALASTMSGSSGRCQKLIRALGVSRDLASTYVLCRRSRGWVSQFQRGVEILLASSRPTVRTRGCE